ncbi:hypothetical protein SVIOM74S_07395 [Streptomyces violarus]
MIATGMIRSLVVACALNVRNAATPTASDAGRDPPGPFALRHRPRAPGRTPPAGILGPAT